MIHLETGEKGRGVSRVCARYFPQSCQDTPAVSTLTLHTNMEDFDKIQTAEFREAFDEFDKV